MCSADSLGSTSPPCIPSAKPQPGAITPPRCNSVIKDQCPALLNIIPWFFHQFSPRRNHGVENDTDPPSPSCPERPDEIPGPPHAGTFHWPLPPIRPQRPTVSISTFGLTSFTGRSLPTLPPATGSVTGPPVQPRVTSRQERHNSYMSMISLR